VQCFVAHAVTTGLTQPRYGMTARAVSGVRRRSNKNPANRSDLSSALVRRTPSLTTAQLTAFVTALAQTISTYKVSTNRPSL
jgi:hypothetical protein